MGLFFSTRQFWKVDILWRFQLEFIFAKCSNFMIDRVLFFYKFWPKRVDFGSPLFLVKARSNIDHPSENCFPHKAWPLTVLSKLVQGDNHPWKFALCSPVWCADTFSPVFRCGHLGLGPLGQPPSTIPQTLELGPEQPGFPPVLSRGINFPERTKVYPGLLRVSNTLCMLTRWSEWDDISHIHVNDPCEEQDPIRSHSLPRTKETQGTATAHEFSPLCSDALLRLHLRRGTFVFDVLTAVQGQRHSVGLFF